MNRKSIVAAGALATLSTPALAHHPLAGMPMETFWHGLLSGFGHPLLGFDHLFFVVAVGIAALYTGYRFFAPAAYIAAMLAGCVMMSLGYGLPAKEIMIGFSLLAVGFVILSGKAIRPGAALFLFAVFGLFHGSAFGDSMAAQEIGFGMNVLAGYLIGLGSLQYAIAIGSGWLAYNVWKATEASAIPARLAGAVVAGMGLFITLENAEAIAFTALGIAG